MNKYELAKKITQLEGLTNEEKASLVELLRSQKKYGLVWEDKPEEIETRLVDELPVLTEVAERAIVSESPDAPNHILIEGDNLEALTALAYTHEGKIDVIYIDPPYNTGNKDFVYNDSFVDREDGYRHSKWLSFMNKRLQIAKSLLSSGGVIFISIGDDEQANLKMLCDEVFLAKNFIEEYVWESTFRPDNSSPILRRNAEFVLCYAKSKEHISYFKGVKSKTEGMPSLTKAKEKIKQITFPANYVRTTLKDGLYPKGKKENGKNPKWELVEEACVKDGLFITPVILKGHSYWSTQKKIQEEISLGTEIWIKSESFVPYYKKTKESISRPTKILDKQIVNDYLFANTEMGNLFERKVFNNPKPTSLISYLIDFCDNQESTILDFFAGSGTTLHATMQLNAEDGGHRKCILVTNNENNICEEVTYERNKRVIQGYTTPKGEEVEGLHDNNLRYYRTNFLSRDKSVKNMRQLVRLATDMLCIKNDVYTEAEFCGKHLNPNIARYFDNGQGNRMLVIYEERAIQLLVQLMAQTEDDGIKTMVYVFSPGADPYTDDFEDVAERVKLCALPSAIYEAYKRVLPKRKPKFLDEALLEMKAQTEAEANAQQTLDFGENDNMNEEGGEA